MIAIDNHGFNIQQNKLTVRTNLGIQGVRRVVKYLNTEYDRLLNYEIDPSQMKAKRLIEEARKRETLEYLQLEKERLLFSQEDIHSRLFEYYDDILEEQFFVNRYLQEYEARLVYPKSKWSLKVAKFTLRILDDLHEIGDESTPQYEFRELENSAINQCQQFIRNILNFQPLVWANNVLKIYLDKTMPISNPEQFPSIAFRYYTIRLISIIAEYMVKYRVKQRRLDIFELVDVRFLALLIPVLKQTLVRLTSHLRTADKTFLNCSTQSSITKNDEEAEKEIEERVLSPLSIQTMRNILDLMQYLPELPDLVQSVLVEQMFNNIYDSSLAPINTFHQLAPTNTKGMIVASSKNNNNEYIPRPASSFPFNRYHIFHDIICLLCTHGSIFRNSSAHALSDAAIVDSRFNANDNNHHDSPSRVQKNRSDKSGGISHALNSDRAKPSNFFYHPTGRRFVLGTGRRSLLHTSAIPDLLQCALYYHNFVVYQLSKFRDINPLPVNKKKPATPSVALKSNLPANSNEIVTEKDLNSMTDIIQAWETHILPLAFRTVQRTLVILGRPGHIGSMILRDANFLQHVDDLIVTSADVTSTFYSHHPSHPTALANRLAWALVQSVHHISHHRLPAIFVQMAFLKLTFAAALPTYYFQCTVSADPIREALNKAAEDASRPPGPPNTQNNNNDNNNNNNLTTETAGKANDKNYYNPQIYRDTINKYPEELLRNELLVMTQRVLAAFAVHHKQSLSITRMCCLNLRLLFREIFVKRTQCEDLLSMNLTSICAPFTASLHKLIVLRDEGGMDDNEGEEHAIDGGEAILMVPSPAHEGNISSANQPKASTTISGEPIQNPTHLSNNRIHSTVKARGDSSHVASHSVSFVLPEDSDGKSVDTFSAFSNGASEDRENEGEEEEEEEGPETDGANDDDGRWMKTVQDNTRSQRTSGLRTRLGGVLEEPTLDDDELHDSLDEHDDANLGNAVTPKEDDAAADDDDDAASGNDLDGGDSLTTVSRLPHAGDTSRQLPPPSKESKVVSKPKKKTTTSASAPAIAAASIPPHGNANGSHASSKSSSQDPLQSHSLKSMVSSTFSVDHYVPAKLFKALPNPLVPKTLQEVNDHDPLLDMIDDNKQDAKKDKAKDGASVTSESTATSYTATLSANASEGQFQEKEKASMMKNAQKVLAKNAAAAGANNTAVMYVTLADILMSAAETHVSHAETFEQILLLVEHIASKSYLCKYVLVETGLPMILQRYLQSQPSNLYMVALTQLCLDAMEI